MVTLLAPMARSPFPAGEDELSAEEELPEEELSAEEDELSDAAGSDAKEGYDACANAGTPIFKIIANDNRMDTMLCFSLIK